VLTRKNSVLAGDLSARQHWSLCWRADNRQHWDDLCWHKVAGGRSTRQQRPFYPPAQIVCGLVISSWFFCVCLCVSKQFMPISSPKHKSRCTYRRWGRSELTSTAGRPAGEATDRDHVVRSQVNHTRERPGGCVARGVRRDLLALVHVLYTELAKSNPSVPFECLCCISLFMFSTRTSKHLLLRMLAVLHALHV
jgi:hypothetical protein